MSQGQLFVAVPPAVAEAINPRSGHSQPGPPGFVVTGTGLGGVTEVRFGSVAAERVEVGVVCRGQGAFACFTHQGPSTWL